MKEVMTGYPLLVAPSAATSLSPIVILVAPPLTLDQFLTEYTGLTNVFYLKGKQEKNLTQVGNGMEIVVRFYGKFKSTTSVFTVPVFPKSKKQPEVVELIQTSLS